VSSPVSVEPDAVTARAAELVAVSGQLAAEPTACRSSAAALEGGLEGDVGRRAAEVTRAWAGLSDLLAEACATSARTLRSAVESYRALDQQLAAEIDGAGPASRTGPR
jgi:uncharacterized protein YukE